MIKELLQKELPNLKLSCDRPYRELTTLGVGSAVPLLAEPESSSQLAELLRLLRSRRFPCFILGAGSNLVGMDDPYPGVAVHPAGGEFAEFRVEDDRLICGAGVRLPQMVQRAAALGMGGIAPLAGIPGSIGGALRMNAGCCGVELSQFLVRIHGVRSDGSAWHAEAADLVWEYRSGGIPADVAVTRAEFRLNRVDPEAEAAAIQQALAERRSREPAGRSAGCAFRNVSDLEPAGRLIDECGLRGLRVGDITVSDKHANYIMNLGSGTEADFITVTRLVRRAVAEKYGFYLRLEARTIRPEATSAIENDPRPPMVNVLYGGDSSEREVSIRSGAAVAKALTNAGFRVVGTDIRQCAILPSMRECDLVYPVLHGGFGEGGDLQELMEQARIKFVGSGSAASRLVMDKLATKRLLDKLGIPTARWREVTVADLDTPPEGLNFPLILKAPCEGSTVGIVRVKTPAEWRAALEAELKFAPALLVEEFIEGIEITVPILSGATAEAIEIRAPGGFYDYDAKYIYKNGHTEYFCPPVTPKPEEIAEAKRLALYFYRAAGCLDVLRVDFIIGRDGVPYVLEGNSIPGMTATSLVPKAARQAGISFESMTSRQLYAALKRSAIPVVSGNSAPAAVKSDDEVSPALLKTARTLYALVLGLAALSLLLTAMKVSADGWSAWQLLVAAVLLVLPIRRWFDRLEKNEKMKKALYLFAVVLAAAPLAAAPTGAPKAVAAKPAETPALATGAEVKELPGAYWVKGDPVKLADLRGKKPAVLFFWTFHQASVNEIPHITAAAKEFAGKAEFIGIGCDDPQRIKNFVYLKEFNFPILADDRLLFVNTFLRRTDRTPIAVVIDRDGRVAWRGRVAGLSAVLKEMIAGKFDLKEEIRREQCGMELGKALALKDYDKALAISADELKRYPDNFELLSLRAGIFCRGTKKPQDAIAELDTAIRHRPGVLPLYELKLKVIRSAKLDAQLAPFYRQVIADFAEKPMVLIKFAEDELKRPLDESHPEHFCNLIRAAYASKGCKNEQERALVTISYARMCHLLGRPELALAAAKQAVAQLGDANKELQKELLIYISYYRTLVEISRQL